MDIGCVQFSLVHTTHPSLTHELFPRHRRKWRGKFLIRATIGLAFHLKLPTSQNPAAAQKPATKPRNQSSSLPSFPVLPPCSTLLSCPALPCSKDLLARRMGQVCNAWSDDQNYFPVRFLRFGHVEASYIQWLTGITSAITAVVSHTSVSRFAHREHSHRTEKRDEGYRFSPSPRAEHGPN